MSNELSILGFGQCGSKVAVEISASFNPTSVLTGENPFSFRLKAIFRRSRKFNRSEIDQSPAFYIADLNTSNDVYVHYAKAQAIRDGIRGIDMNDISPRDIISRINKNQGNVSLDEGDIAIIDQVKRQKEALKMVRALYFESNNRPLLEIGGAGGLQYISEAIAGQDKNIMNSIDKRLGGALIGIFSIGGGTGSGSLYAILTKYKNEIHRYTVGVGILPDRQNVKQFINAGRYLTKYLGSKPSDRFHTLFLFSNEVARDVLIEEKKFEDNAEPFEIMNNYISSFIHDFSMINDQKTLVKFGKLFDPMDGKRFLSGVCTVGFSSDERFSAKEIFVNAVSPMHYKDEMLSGVAVRLTQEKHGVSEGQELKKMISDCVDQLEINDLDSDLVHGIQEKTPFYRSIKSVLVFYFIRDPDFQSDVFNFQRTIIKFFEQVAGDHISIEVNCYYAPETSPQRSSVLILFNGAFSFEIYDSLLEFAKNNFVDKKENMEEFREKVNQLLVEVVEAESGDADDVIARGIEDILVSSNCNMIEEKETDLLESMSMLNHPDVRSSLSSEILEEILLKREHMRAALVELVKQFTLGRTKKKAVSDPFGAFRRR